MVHSLSFRSSVIGSATVVLLNNVARDWGDVVVVLLEVCWTPRRFHISSTTAVDQPNIPIGIALKTLLFGRIFRKVQRSRCCSCRQSVPAIPCWTRWSSASGSNPWGTIPCAGASQTFRTTSWLCSRVLYPAARLQKEVLQWLQVSPWLFKSIEGSQEMQAASSVL